MHIHTPYSILFIPTIYNAGDSDYTTCFAHFNSPLTFRVCITAQYIIHYMYQMSTSWNMQQLCCNTHYCPPLFSTIISCVCETCSRNVCMYIVCTYIPALLCNLKPSVCQLHIHGSHLHLCYWLCTYIVLLRIILQICNSFILVMSK
jgi:hypothetical protein